ncbi:MAG: hypothetical protein ACO4CH_10880 [Saprospiraceae bacterium]
MHYLISLLFLLSAFGPHGMNSHYDDLSTPLFTGKWRGVITQDEGGYRKQYDIEIHFSVNGTRVVGESYISTDDIFVRMNVEGKVTNDMFIVLEDTRIVEHKIKPDMQWCMKRYQLIFKAEEDKIDGFWEGDTLFGRCVPGKVHLQRFVPKA